ncbi:hypothetical protein FNV43_RR18742 [Rhamnella rubrinervis]|uniref:Glycosyltransferase n=1 Tax=Rhamnella rubrinervis TaxID=2594499 RepID=A0A8K0GWN5_9ROSA|nr:hypothetical protein FNV43_RR18742 [Rhamnella rubrinervis]
MEKKAQLVFIPLPFWSHLIPTIELAKLIAKHDHQRLSITVLLMKSPSMDSKLDSYVQSLASTSDAIITFILLPCNYLSAETNHRTTMTTFVESQKPHVKNAVAKLIGDSESDHQIAGFVVDFMCTSMMDVAKELGLPTYVFSTASAGSVSLVFHLQALHDEHNIDFTEFKNDPRAELVLPSFVNPVPSCVLPDIMRNKTAFSLHIDYFRRIREEAKGILVNTFIELESHAVGSFSGSKFPPIYPVGPIVNLATNDENGSDSTVIKWLDDQPPTSVVFLCFGNLGSFIENQVKEIARAIENSGIRFIWSLRQRRSNDGSAALGSYADDSTDVLPEGFLNRTAGMGKVIGWAPQAAILSHLAIGGFVSHCGWNSTLESLWYGVPIATWPLYGEQQVNAFALVRELGLAVEIKLDYYMVAESENDQMVVSAQEIEAGISRVMEKDSDTRMKVKEISENGKKALMDGGSSYTSLDRLIDDIINNKP